eukprot:8666318-Alexandrium_andersonii.AAC.1
MASPSMVHGRNGPSGGAAGRRRGFSLRHGALRLGRRYQFPRGMAPGTRSSSRGCAGCNWHLGR